MRSTLSLIAGLSAALALAGCQAPTRMATKVTDVPRVDIGLEGGNRGYLVGTPPPADGLKTTRQMVETTIEIPSLYKPKRGVGVPAAPPAAEMEPAFMPESDEAAAFTGPHDTYVVQQGDSLWSVAAKPEIYGRASRWRRIFDANRDLLKSPDRLKAGMTLKIPRGETGGTAYDDEDVTYKK